MTYARWAFVLFTLLAAAVPVGAASPNLAYVDLGTGGSACCLVPDGLGNVYVVGSVVDDSRTNVSVTKLDSNNRVAARFSFGGGLTDQPQAAALDAQGNLVIAGQTLSLDFPLVGALISQTEPGAPAGFLAKVNPSNGQILFSTRIGGMAKEVYHVGTSPHAVALDPAGNIYVAGETNAPDFPVSANAFQKTGAGGDSFAPQPFGFVMKFSASGDRLLYSTLLGGKQFKCSYFGSSCMSRYAATAIHAIAVDRQGLVTVAGHTNALDFPATPGALQTTCHCLDTVNNGFVTRLNTDGSGVVWSTFLGAWLDDSYPPRGVNEVSALSLGAAGDVIVAGMTDAGDFPTTAGTLQPRLAGGTDGFLTKLNATGTALLFSTYLGGSADDAIGDLSIDGQGNFWVTGTTASADFPGTAASFTGSFFAEVSPDGASRLRSQKTPSHGSGQAIRAVADGNLWILGLAGSVLQAPGGQIQGFSVLGSAGSAGGDVKGFVAPGEFITLYGNLPGPASGAGAVFDANGRIATELAGVQVLFDGIPAPLLYVSSSQINALAPYGLAGRAETTVEVTIAGGNSPTFQLYVRPAQPEVFTSNGWALALNQDGSVNSPVNPAAPGSIVTIWASGAGMTSSGFVDGSIATAAYFPVPTLPVAVLQNNLSIEVLYAGPSPGLVINALQINMRLSQQFGSDLRLRIGDFVSAPFLIVVR